MCYCILHIEVFKCSSRAALCGAHCRNQDGKSLLPSGLNFLQALTLNQYAPLILNGRMSPDINEIRL